MKPGVHNKLFDKATAAITSAVEIYNKPGFQYRDEAFALLALNAWELLLKARVVQLADGKSTAIYVYEKRKKKDGTHSNKEYVKRNRSENPLTISIFAAISKLDGNAKTQLPEAVKNNITALTEVRDCASHFFNTSMALRKQLLQVGTATVRNFVWYSKSWFKKDLSSDLQILLPIGFMASDTVLVATSVEEKKLLACIGALAKASTSSETVDIHFCTNIEIRIDKSSSVTASAMRITNDPQAVAVVLTEENLAQTFPWTYKTLGEKCAERYANFKQDAKYHAERKKYEGDTKLCRIRLLDPSNSKGMKKTFYSPNILQQLDSHYEKK
jgi:Protein of unknown function (DUF3644)/EC042_2821-lke REase